MNDEGFTPSDLSVRIAYVYIGEQNKSVTELRDAAFDRWLVEHDRAVAEKAWARGCYEGIEMTSAFIPIGLIDEANPYKPLGARS